MRGDYKCPKCGEYCHISTSGQQIVHSCPKCGWTDQPEGSSNNQEYDTGNWPLS